MKAPASGVSSWAMRFAQPERTISEHLNPCGSELARDRRRSRLEPGLRGLPDAPRHPILLPLRARSRASHAPTRDSWRCQNWCQSTTCGPACSRRRDAELVGVSLLSIGDAVVVNPGYAVCLMRRVIRFCCRCAPDRGQATLLQGICGVARICVKALPVGQLAREDVTQNLWE